MRVPGRGRLLALLLLSCCLGGTANGETASGGTAGSAKANDGKEAREDRKAFGEWSIKQQDALLRDITHGTEVWGHEFGLIRKLSHCDDPIIWVEWSTTKVHAGDLKQGSAVSLELSAGGTTIPVDLKLMAAGQLTPHTTVFALTNFAVTDDFIALLKRSNSVRLRVTGPASFLKMLDIDAETFTLKGFEEADAEAVRLCKKLSGI